MRSGPEDDDLDLPPLPPLGSDESVGTGDMPLGSTIDLDPGEGEQVGLDDAEAQLDDLDPASLLDFVGSEAIAPDDGSLAPGIELDLGDEVANQDGEGEYGWRDGTEAPTHEEWEGDAGITTLADIGEDDAGETGLDDLVMGLQGDDALPELPALEDEGEGEPLADDLDLGDALSIEDRLTEGGEPTEPSEGASETPDPGEPEGP
jgi:hypothetical protein